ncbi:MAG: sporulation protein YqfD [Clostridia bacterium]|nr:sporulation protein YqfD [Clostridia bacterium]
MNIIRSICGYVEFKVIGGNPDKFLNLSVKQGHSLWDVRKINGDLLAKSRVEDYKKLHINARKSNSRIRILKKKGLPFFRHKYRSRTGVIIGLTLFLVVLSVLPLYLWKVEVVGCEMVSPEEVKKVMHDLGVSPGTLKSHINIPILKQQIMQRMDSIAWISINLNGSDAIVEIKEKQLKLEKDAEGEPSNIVALYDGRIKRMETYRGTPMVSDGEVVTKGQVLISGIVEDLSGGAEFVDAEGKVYAETHRIITEKVDMNRVRAHNVGEEIKRYRLKILSLEIPICFEKPPDENCICETTEKNLNVFGYKLPISLYKDSIYMQEICSEKLSEDDAAKEADRIIDQRTAQEFGDEVKIKNEERRFGTISPDGEQYQRECHYDLVENIAKKEKLILDD